MKNVYTVNIILEFTEGCVNRSASFLFSCFLPFLLRWRTQNVSNPEQMLSKANAIKNGQSMRSSLLTPIISTKDRQPCPKVLVSGDSNFILPSDAGDRPGTSQNYPVFDSLLLRLCRKTVFLDAINASKTLSTLTVLGWRSRSYATSVMPER